MSFSLWLQVLEKFFLALREEANSKVCVPKRVVIVGQSLIFSFLRAFRNSDKQSISELKQAKSLFFKLIEKQLLR
jgi:hypothetical protein